METPRKTNQYPPLARMLHWASAVVILWATCTGLVLAMLDHDSEVRAALSWFNVSLTTSFSPIFVVRIAYAVYATKPAALNAAATTRRAVKIMHVALYIVTLVVLISGVLMMDHAISVFSLLELKNPVDDALWNRRFYGLHRCSCAVLILLLIGHIGAAILHQRAGCDVLSRMSLDSKSVGIEGVAAVRISGAEACAKPSLPLHGCAVRK